MNAKGALKEAVKRWGETAAVSDRKDRASTPERRGEALEAMKALRAQIGKRRPTKEERVQLDELFSESQRYRFTVGHISMGIAFHVRGKGDTWEAAFAAADAQAEAFRKAA